MWDLPGPGLEPTSPALAGGFLTTAPPGKASNMSFKEILIHGCWYGTKGSYRMVFQGHTAAFGLSGLVPKFKSWYCSPNLSFNKKRSLLLAFSQMISKHLIFFICSVPFHSNMQFQNSTVSFVRNTFRYSNWDQPTQDQSWVLSRANGFLSIVLLLRAPKIDLIQHYILKAMEQGFPRGEVVENLPANAGDTGSSPGPGRSHMPRSN